MAKIEEIRIPDIGGTEAVTVSEVLVAVGDTVAVEDSLITLESDKASMDVPAPFAGTVKELKLAEGDEVGEGALVLLLEVSDAAPAAETPDQPAATPETATPETNAPETAATAPAEEPKAAPAPQPAPTPAAPAPAATTETARASSDFSLAYASPSVRRLARELGVDLGQVTGTGRKGRITHDDVRSFVKGILAGGGVAAAGAAGGGGVSGFEWPQMPEVDFSAFGPVEEKKLHRIRQVAARNLHRSWLHVPHVTQHEEADITEMEAFRKAQGEEAKKRGSKLTPLAFLLKAAAAALGEFPEFNSSLHPEGDRLILKRYYHLGVAVDTPNGLVVPVLRDVDQKGLFELGRELIETSAKAREGKLTPRDFQGATFTISSLGGIGGTAFTPIVNAPEVAILGVSRSRMTPVWDGQQFQPRLMLPLSLSYDHRVIDGASAARFVVYLAGVLGDLRRLLL